MDKVLLFTTVPLSTGAPARVVGMPAGRVNGTSTDYVNFTVLLGARAHELAPYTSRRRSVVVTILSLFFDV